MQELLHFSFAGNKIPGVAIMEHSGACHLSAVDHRASADCQQNIDMFLEADIYCSLHGRRFGVWLYSAKFEQFHARILYTLGHGWVPSGVLNPATVKNQQGLGTVAAQFTAGLFQLIVSKINMSQSMPLS